MIKSIKRIKENEPLEYNQDGKDMVFKELRKDTIGKSSSNPTWGYVFNVREGKLKLNKDGEGLFKEFDYDAPQAAYAEKIISIIGMDVLQGTKVPKVDVVLERKREPSIISYKLLDNNKEDMYHISDLMFYKYDRSEIGSKKNIFTIEDILQCVKEQIKNEENYKQVEKNIIHTLLLDSITNNADRHSNNWALIRDKQTNLYQLAIFDHSSALVDMIEEKAHFTYNGWVCSYVTTNDNNKNRRGDIGKDIIEHISKDYPEYLEEFCDIFNEKLPSILEKINEENLPIDMKRLERKLIERNRFLNKVKDKEDSEHEH